MFRFDIPISELDVEVKQSSSEGDSGRMFLTHEIEDPARPSRVWPSPPQIPDMMISYFTRPERVSVTQHRVGNEAELWAGRCVPDLLGRSNSLNIPCVTQKDG